MCEDVRQGCEPLLRLMGYSWPEEVNCDNFPTEAPCLNETGIDLGPERTSAPVTVAEIASSTTTQITDGNLTTTTIKTLVIGKNYLLQKF